MYKKIFKQVLDCYDGDAEKAYYEIMDNGGYNAFDGNYIEDIFNLADRELFYAECERYFKNLIDTPKTNKLGYDLEMTPEQRSALINRLVKQALAIPIDAVADVSDMSEDEIDESIEASLPLPQKFIELREEGKDIDAAIELAGYLSAYFANEDERNKRSKGGKKGSKTINSKLSKKEMSEKMRKAAQARWAKVKKDDKIK